MRHNSGVIKTRHKAVELRRYNSTHHPFEAVPALVDDVEISDIIEKGDKISQMASNITRVRIVSIAEEDKS